MYANRQLQGFVFGPIAFGPMSEVLGRKLPLFIGFALFAIFQIPVALAQNVTTICVGRFLGGFFASAPLAVVGGALADLWDPIPRAYAICVFATGGFAGPVAGPIAGGFITESHLGWRWTSWITLIMAGLFGTIGFFVIPETSAARILQLRAAKFRKDSGDAAYYSKAGQQKLTIDTVVNVYLLRPFVMIAQEPILALVTAYMSFLYGIVYLLFEAFPVSFHEERGWSLGVSQLPFGAFIVGIMMGAGLIAYSTATNFTRSFKKHGKSIPEERLPPMIVGAIALPVGLFWYVHISPGYSDSCMTNSGQVCVDQQSQHHMGTSSTLYRADRSGMHGTVLAGCQLSHRLLRILLEQRHCCQHLHTVLRWRFLSAVHAYDVSQSGRTLGKQLARVHLRCIHSSTDLILHIRS